MAAQRLFCKNFSRPSSFRRRRARRRSLYKDTTTLQMVSPDPDSKEFESGRGGGGIQGLSMTVMHVSFVHTFVAFLELHERCKPSDLRLLAQEIEPALPGSGARCVRSPRLEAGRFLGRQTQGSTRVYKWASQFRPCGRKRSISVKAMVNPRAVAALASLTTLRVR